MPAHKVFLIQLNTQDEAIHAPMQLQLYPEHPTKIRERKENSEGIMMRREAVGERVKGRIKIRHLSKLSSPVLGQHLDQPSTQYILVYPLSPWQPAPQWRGLSESQTSHPEVCVSE